MSGSGVPVHTPLWQVSPVVQVLLSLHAVPSGWKASAGQVLDEPSQLSATSHPSAAGRHTAVLFASAGQWLFGRSWFSATSNGPAEGRHCAVLLPSAGQAALEPVQFSATSQTPAEARHTTVLGRKPSGGQSLLTPSQLSDVSQMSATGRHSAVLLTSAGHAAFDPVQFSATSQAPAAARQVVPDGNSVLAGQSALFPVQPT